MSQSVFLILSTNAVGGAEKRFAGLWYSVIQNSCHENLYLVGSKQLLDALKKQEGLGAFLATSRGVIEHDFSGGFKAFRNATKSFVRKYSRFGDILHFIGDHPLFDIPGRKVVYSITQSSFKNLNFRGKVGQLVGVMLSDVTDVLDPSIYKYLKILFFWKTRNIHQTTNSFCDERYFSSLPFVHKKDWFVFLGRFEKMKQVTTLLSAIPSLYHSLKKYAVNDLHFFLLGHGSLEDELRQMLLEKRFDGIPVTVKYHNQPQEILRQSRYFFSMQLYNNYPSKSLLEAMASGNIPIVTDVGQTRWLAKPEFSYYVPEHFTAEDIRDVVIGIYSQEQNVLASKATLASEFVKKGHTIEKMREYYLSLYK